MTARTTHSSLYAGRHPAQVPAYSLAEAAHWLDLPRATVRAWSLGQPYRQGGQARLFQPVIAIADPEQRLLSFRNLVELHVLAAIRRKHAVSLQNVRKAVKFMRDRLRVEHPLASRRMLTDGKDLLVEHSEELLNISKAGQLEMRRIVEAYLSRVVHGEDEQPARLFPFTTAEWDRSSRAVVIDPTIQFGRPCLAGTGIPTTVIAERFRAGESLEDIAADYDRTRSEVEEALRYETALAA